jgi:hypothetical protein
MAVLVDVSEPASVAAMVESVEAQLASCHQRSSDPLHLQLRPPASPTTKDVALLQHVFASRAPRGVNPGPAPYARELADPCYDSLA